MRLTWMTEAFFAQNTMDHYHYRSLQQTAESCILMEKDMITYIWHESFIYKKYFQNFQLKAITEERSKKRLGRKGERQREGRQA